MQSANSSTKPQFPLLENEGSGSEIMGRQQWFPNLADYKNKPFIWRRDGKKKETILYADKCSLHGCFEQKKSINKKGKSSSVTMAHR